MASKREAIWDYKDYIGHVGVILGYWKRKWKLLFRV